jgi:hypothetical protein
MTSTSPEIKSAFDHVEATQWDPIVEILEEYRLCTDPNKINLTIGAYRDETLQPVVFKCVRQAEERLFNQKVSVLPMKICNFNVDKDLDDKNIDPFFLAILKKYN